MDNLTLSKNKSNNIEIKAHLERCDELFTPKLSSYINLEAYSNKLYEFAERYEVFSKSKLVGLVAVYISEKVCFISNFSVEKEFLGKGLSHKLMEYAINDFDEQQLSIINLEVFKDNKRAINFYEKYGFRIKTEESSKLIMTKYI